VPAARPRRSAGQPVSIDALHTQAQTAREVVLAHGGDYLLSVKGNQPGVEAVVQAQVPDPGSPPFAPLNDPSAVRWTDLEKGDPVTRTLVVRPLDGETAGFPLVAQAARVHRQRAGLKPETVELITSRPAGQLSPAQWLEANISHWGIETGLHARLDASRHDDRCRLRRRPALWIHGMFNRWANSLLMHWIHSPAQRSSPHHHRFYLAHVGRPRPARHRRPHLQTLSFVNRRWNRMPPQKRHIA
jgi:predicted transposase YbfD/YdcC